MRKPNETTCFCQNTTQHDPNYIHKSDQTHGPHGLLEWVKKTTCPKSLKKGRNEHENYSIVTLLLLIIPNLPENIPYVLFREDFVSTWDVCFFGKPKAILVLLTTKARLRDCSNEVSCWKCSKDLWWPEFFGLFGWGDGHLRVYTTPANAKPSTKALLRDIFFKGQWWLSHSEVLLFPLLGSLDFHDERSMITFPETNMIAPTRGCVGPQREISSSSNHPFSGASALSFRGLVCKYLRGRCVSTFFSMENDDRIPLSTSSSWPFRVDSWKTKTKTSQTCWSNPQETN